MRRWVALLLLPAVMLVAAPEPADAGASEDAALALGAFAVLNQLVRGETILHDIFGGSRTQTVVVHQPAVVAPPPPVVYAPPPPVVYAPRPVVVAPRPVVVRPAPVVVTPRPVVVYEAGHGHKHGRKHVIVHKPRKVQRHGHRWD